MREKCLSVLLVLAMLLSLLPVAVLAESDEPKIYSSITGKPIDLGNESDESSHPVKVVKFNETSIPRTYNGINTSGHWVGYIIEAPAGANYFRRLWSNTTITEEMVKANGNDDLLPSGWKEVKEVETLQGRKGYDVWYDASRVPSPAYFSIQWYEDEDGTKTVGDTMVLKADVSGVGLQVDPSLVSAVEAVEDGGYSVALDDSYLTYQNNREENDSAYSIKVTATALEKTTYNGTEGHWVSIKIRQFPPKVGTAVYKYTSKNEQYSGIFKTHRDNETWEEKETDANGNVTFYFNLDEIAGRHAYIIERGVVDGSTKSIINYDIDFSKVTFKEAKYTVTFNVGEGVTQIPQQEVTVNGTATEPEVPTKTGYTFGGWYKDAECTNEWDFTADTVREDTTLYAKWTPVTTTYTVTFNLNGATGTAPATQPIGADQKATEPTAPSREGYTFGGWYKDAECEHEWDFTADTVREDTTLYAKWIPVTTTYTVTFDLNGATGTAPATQTIESGQKVTKPADPDREGYTFGGWYKDAECEHEWDFTADTVREDTTLYAKWTPVTTTYTVTFDLNGAAGTAPATQTIGADQKATEPKAPSREGYTFGGWYKDAECEHGWNFTADTVREDTTLYAKWIPVTTTYTVTFDLNGAAGTAPATQTIESGQKVTKPADPDREGYTFDGWYKDAECTNVWDFATDTVTQNITFYAKWTANQATNPTEPDPSDTYSISIDSYWHGRVSLSDTYAKPGKLVTITADPDTDYTVDSVIVRRSSGGRVSVWQSGRRYSFTMPSSDVSVEVEFALQGVYAYTVYIPPEPAQTTVTPVVTARTWRPAVTMRDVPAYSWAYPFAQWAYQNGYLDLAADGTFRLNDPVTNMQMWRIMAQWLGGPVWDEGSILNWANQNGAARGKVASGSMTRQNVVEYIYQSYFLLGGDVSVTGNLATYRDNQLITSVASRNAWTWAVNKGLISGTPDGYLNPGGVVTRGEFAAILTRLCQNIMQ